MLRGKRQHGAATLPESDPVVQGEIKLPRDYCSADLGPDSKLEVVLPRRQGLGLCSTALVSYLIGLHNEMVYTVAKFSEEESE